jgi:hypothetical protein
MESLYQLVRRRIDGIYVHGLKLALPAASEHLGKLVSVSLAAAVNQRYYPIKHGGYHVLW